MFLNTDYNYKEIREKRNGAGPQPSPEDKSLTPSRLPITSKGTVSANNLYTCREDFIS
jgi:hypothetical protein